MKCTLILIRGVSGSGKTTYARKLLQQHDNLVHLEADMYFYNDNQYIFNSSKLKQAHSWCLSNTTQCLKDGKSVVVSNTFTQKWEIQPYLDVAKLYNVDINIMKAIGCYNNVHGVCPETVRRMQVRWQDVDGEQTIQAY